MPWSLRERRHTSGKGDETGELLEGFKLKLWPGECHSCQTQSLHTVYTVYS